MPDRPERDRDLDALKSSVRAFAEKHHARRAFEPGVTPVRVTGKFFDHEEFELLLEAALDGWWTEGRFTQQVAADLAGFLGTRDVLLCNSGSSANLLAVTELTSGRLHTPRVRAPPLTGRRRGRGDWVFGAAPGFPTPSAPGVQGGCVPVLLDIELGTYNVD